MGGTCGDDVCPCGQRKVKSTCGLIVGMRCMCHLSSPNRKVGYQANYRPSDTARALYVNNIRIVTLAEGWTIIYLIPNLPPKRAKVGSCEQRI